MSLAKSTRSLVSPLEEARVQALQEGSEVLTDVSQEDLRDNAALMTTTTLTIRLLVTLK